MLANISSELSTIQNGRYGEDIRTAIKEAIRKVNDAGYMPVVENLNVNANGTYTPSAGVNGFSKVVVNVPTGGGGYPEPTGTIQITENGIANVKDYASANVNVQPSLQSKTATQNGTVTPDDGYDGLSSVVVNVSGGGGGGEPLPMTVTASSTFSQSPKQPSGIFGDVAGNFWGSNGTNNWLNINFTTPFNLKKVRLSNYYMASATTYWYSSNITVRASNDGFATYTDLYTGTGLAQSDTQFEIDLNNSDAYIEYRFIVSDATAYAGLGRVELSGETAILLQSKTATQNGTVTPDDGYDGLSSVVVNVPVSGSVITEVLSVTANGTYTPPSGVDGYSEVMVNVPAAGISMDDIAMRSISGSIYGSASYIGSFAFATCSSLTNVSFPACTNIGNYAFYTCSSLTEASFPACTNIGESVFYYCSSLSYVDFPACTSIGSYAFTGCRSLTSVNFPACTSIGTQAFAYCSSLTSVSSPACASISNGAFWGCSSLTSVSFPACTSIGGNAFYKCYNLLSLYLTGSSLCKLAYSNAFTSTPIAGYTTSTGGVYGSIYVPTSLLISYKSASNWSYYSERFVGI